MSPTQMVIGEWWLWRAYTCLAHIRVRLLATAVVIVGLRQLGQVCEIVLGMWLAWGLLESTARYQIAVGPEGIEAVVTWRAGRGWVRRTRLASWLDVMGVSRASFCHRPAIAIATSKGTLRIVPGGDGVSARETVATVARFVSDRCAWR